MKSLVLVRGKLPLLSALAMACAMPALAQEAASPDEVERLTAEQAVISTVYSCERNVNVPVSYINHEPLALAVLNVEGRQYAMRLAISGSGARYEALEPAGEGHYVWWTKGETATLIWQPKAEGAEDVVLFNACNSSGAEAPDDGAAAE